MFNEYHEDFAELHVLINSCHYMFAQFLVKWVQKAFDCFWLVLLAVLIVSTIVCVVVLFLYLSNKELWIVGEQWIQISWRRRVFIIWNSVRSIFLLKVIFECLAEKVKIYIMLDLCCFFGVQSSGRLDHCWSCSKKSELQLEFVMQKCWLQTNLSLVFFHSMLLFHCMYQQVLPSEVV